MYFELRQGHFLLKHDISAIEYEIQVAKESQAKFEKWDVRKVKQGNITDLFVGYKRQIIMNSQLLKQLPGRENMTYNIQ
jgi:hypothetical protein